VVVAALAAVAGGLWLAPATSQAATPTTYTISVDWGAPAGHNFEYDDFFPRTGISVHNGDIIDFKVPAAASTDGLHIVGLVKQGESINQAFADPANALIVPDNDESGANPLENVPVFLGSAPPPGSGAPGACGDQATPCSYDGTAEIFSGQLPPGGADYFVKLALPTGFTGEVDAVDFGHPVSDPSAAINVVADSAAASAQSDLNSAANSQASADTSDALAAESAASTDSVTTNSDGTHTHSVHAGASTNHVEIMEMLPSTVHAAHGDHVTWTTGGTSDPHTVQFPSFLSGSVTPFSAPLQCEGSGGDTVSPSPQDGPPSFGCAAGATPEVQLVTSPQGTNVIRSPAYRLVASDGGIFNFGQSSFHGSAGNLHLNSPIVATAATADQQGYYEVAADGGIFTYGDAGFFGSEGGKKISAPIVGMGADAAGYLLIGADGATYSFGDVPPVPSGQVPAHLAAPIVGGAGMNAPSMFGIALAARDGGVFTLNGAPYLGSMGGKHLNAPIVGIASTPDGNGYWLVASDGGIFSFGDAAFHGSTGNLHLAAPIAGMVPTPSGNGYWLVARDGGVFSFGDATFHGSMGGTHLNAPVVGIDGTFSIGSSGVLINIPAGNPNAIPSRASYTYTFADPGDYSFMCGFHQMMTGTVLVS